MKELNKKWFYIAKPKMHNGIQMYFITYNSYDQEENRHTILGLYWALTKKDAKNCIESLIEIDKLEFGKIKTEKQDTQNWIIRKVER